MPFTKELPRWENAGAQPPEEKLISGWSPTEKVPAPWLNWYFNGVYEVLKEMKEKGVTAEELEAAISSINVEVIDSVTSTDKTKPASANSVKTAYDKAVAAETNAKKYIDDNFEKVTDSTPNLLRNSSGLLGLSGWTITGPSQNYWSYSNNDTHYGSYLFTNAVVGTGAYSTLESDAIVVGSNSWLRFQGMFHTLGTTDGSVFIEVVDPDKGTIIKQHQLKLNTYWFPSGFNFRVPSDVTRIKVRLITTANTKNEWRCFTRLKLARINSDVDKFLEYSNEADASLMKGYTDSLPWQKIQVTAENGAAKDISNNDLNAYRHTGFYMGSQLTNAPDNNTADWWFIEQIVHNSEYVIQNAYPLSNGGMANGMRQRRKVAGVWKPWSADLFQYVSDGKALLKGTIVTGKGGTVSQAGSVPTFAELNAGINSIQQGRYASQIITRNVGSEERWAIAPNQSGVIGPVIASFVAGTKLITATAQSYSIHSGEIIWSARSGSDNSLWIQPGLVDDKGTFWILSKENYSNGVVSTQNLYIFSIAIDLQEQTAMIICTSGLNGSINAITRYNSTMPEGFNKNGVTSLRYVITSPLNAVNQEFYTRHKNIPFKSM